MNMIFSRFPEETVKFVSACRQKKIFLLPNYSLPWFLEFCRYSPKIVSDKILIQRSGLVSSLLSA